MHSPEPIVSRSFRRIAIVSVLTLTIASLALFFSIRFYAAHRLSEAKRDTAAAGFPVTLEELDRYYNPGPGSRENGLAIIHALEKQNGKPVGDIKPLLFFDCPAPGVDIDSRSIQVTRDFVAQNRASLDDLISLLDRDKPVRYPVDFSTYPIREPAYYDQIHSAGRLLSADALLCGLDGKTGQAVVHIRSMYRLADTLRSEPTLNAQICRLVSLNHATDSLEFILTHAALTNEQLFQIQKVITSVSDDGALARALAGQRCQALARLERRPPGVPDIAYLLLEPYDRMERANLIKSIGRFIEIARLSPERRLEAAIAYGESLRTGPSFLHMTTQAHGLTIARSISLDIRTSSYLSVASTGIATYRYFQEHDRFPFDLNELVPGYLAAVDIDPFDRNPLKYATSSQGAVVYSIGHDGDDDGGVLPPKDESIVQDGDIIFRLVVR